MSGSGKVVVEDLVHSSDAIQTGGMKLLILSRG